MTRPTKENINNVAVLLGIILSIFAILGAGYAVAAYPHRLDTLERNTVPELRAELKRDLQRTQAEVDLLRSVQTANRELLLRIDERIQRLQLDVGELKRRQ